MAGSLVTVLAGCARPEGHRHRTPLVTWDGRGNHPVRPPSPAGRTAMRTSPNRRDRHRWQGAGTAPRFSRASPTPHTGFLLRLGRFAAISPIPRPFVQRCSRSTLHACWCQGDSTRREAVCRRSPPRALRGSRDSSTSAFACRASRRWCRTSRASAPSRMRCALPASPARSCAQTTSSRTTSRSATSSCDMASIPSPSGRSAWRAGGGPRHAAARRRVTRCMTPTGMMRKVLWVRPTPTGGGVAPASPRPRAIESVARSQLPVRRRWRREPRRCRLRAPARE